VVAKRIWSRPEEARPLVFSRQLLPDAKMMGAVSITNFATILCDLIAAQIEASQPWAFQVFPHYGSAKAGWHRCELVRKVCLSRLGACRGLIQNLQEQPVSWSRAHSLVRLMLTAPDRGFLSVVTAPNLWHLRSLISPFPDGEIPVAVDKSAPSRAFAKLLEAELRLGRSIQTGQTCVDLGAAPGSWSYVALRRGARVCAVDRAPLREDLMIHPGLIFRRGDAFAFAPEHPVDWLLCDVIAMPERTIGLLLEWTRRRRMRHFVVTIKFKGATDYAKLDRLNAAMPPLCEDFYLTRLCANKNEVCAFGTVN